MKRKDEQNLIKSIFSIMAVSVIITILCMFAPVRILGAGKGVPAELSGVVIRPSGINDPQAQFSPVEGAVVTLKVSGIEYTQETNKMGGFIFPNLLAGEYVLSIHKPGFCAYTTRLVLRQGEVRRLETIALRGGDGVSTVLGLVMPDTAYIALGYDDKLFQPVKTDLFHIQRLLYEKNPIGTPFDFTCPYDEFEELSFYENSLMLIDPQNCNRISYLKLVGSPTWLSFNIAGTKLYVATDQNIIQMYDVLRNTVLTGRIGLPQGSMASSMKLSPDGTKLYVSYIGGNGIMAVNARTFQEAGSFGTSPVADGQPGIPGALEISKDNKILYTALQSPDSGKPGEVVAFNVGLEPLAAAMPLAKVKVGAYPTGIALSPDGEKLFVANYGSGNVTMLSTNPLATLMTTSVGPNPTHLVFSPDGSKVYVTCRGNNTVVVLDGSTGAFQGSINVGEEPLDIAISGDGSKVYVTNNGDRTVSVIDTYAECSKKVTKPQVLSRPYGVAIKP